MLKGITISFFVDSEEEEKAIRSVVEGRTKSCATLKGSSFTDVKFSGRENLRSVSLTTQDPMYIYVLGYEVGKLMMKDKAKLAVWLAKQGL